MVTTQDIHLKAATLSQAGEALTAAVSRRITTENNVIPQTLHPTRVESDRLH